MVVLTSRPTGLDEDIAPEHFRKFALGQFTSAQALHYGELVANVRLAGQNERRKTVHARLTEASRDENLKHLMQTPLQVLIMSIILETSGSLPPDRYGLFDSYYDTIYKREAGKPIPIAKLLADNRAHVDRIHDRVGFELHVSSELAEGHVADMPAGRLEQIAYDELNHHGYDVRAADAGLVTALAAAARTRLVLVVPVNDGLGFEVRSLQELMAARYLATGNDEWVQRRLRIAATSPHWRNAWIFTAGRVFRQGQDHQRAALVELVRTLDDDAAGRLGRICPAAPQLALDLVDDGMARQYPNLESELLRVGLQLLNHPPPSSPLDVARSLVRAAHRSPPLKTVITNAFRAALGTGAAETTKTIQARIETAAKELEASVNAASLRLVLAGSTSAPLAPQPNYAYWESLKTDGLAIAPSAAMTSHHFGAALDELMSLHQGKSSSIDAIIRALGDVETATVIELLLEGLTPTDWRITRVLRDAVTSRLWRQPVGDKLD